MESKIADYIKKVKQYDLDNAFSDDEITELEIKKKINDFHRD